VAIQTTVDRFGRVVIPKASRDHFGLGPGSAVTLVDAEDGILLKPGAPETALVSKGGVIVFSGEVVGDVAGLARRARDERLRRFFPGRKR
jgi:AbrB family looped-hinge helix DNA binding protein